jgi:hypothetical protein
MKRRTFRSPIEAMLHAGIVAAADAQAITIFDYSVIKGSPRIVFDDEQIGLIDEPEHHETWGAGMDEWWCLFGDVACLSYRLDFVLRTNHGMLTIECDGHEWHDRTKEQAAHDRRRDRDLLRIGLPTIRFTGSEIHRDIATCVDDVCTVARALAGRERRTFDAYKEGRAVGMRLAAQLGQPPEEHW